MSSKLWETLETLLPEKAAFPAGWPGGIDGTCLCCTLAALGGLAATDGLRQWHDVLPRLRNWQKQGARERLHLALLVRLRGYDAIDWSRVSIDRASVANPGRRTDRAEPDRSGQARYPLLGMPKRPR